LALNRSLGWSPLSAATVLGTGVSGGAFQWSKVSAASEMVRLGTPDVERPLCDRRLGQRGVGWLTGEVVGQEWWGGKPSAIPAASTKDWK
jgi:hypothetical protein